jgi:hypothetical protein
MELNQGSSQHKGKYGDIVEDEARDMDSGSRAAVASGCEPSLYL